MRVLREQPVRKYRRRCRRPSIWRLSKASVATARYFENMIHVISTDDSEERSHTLFVQENAERDLSPIQVEAGQVEVIHVCV